MKLAPKIIATVAAVMALLAIASIAILAGVFYPQYARLDDEMARRAYERVSHTVEAEAGNLSTLDREWAEWDDTYNFAGDRNPRYISENLTATEFQVLNVDSVVFADSSGKVFRVQNALRPAGLPSFKVGENVTTLVPAMPKLSGKATVWMTMEKIPSLVAVEPVLPSSGTGPARGTLLFVRHMDPARLKALRQQADVDFRFVSGTLAQEIPSSRASASAITNMYRLHTSPGQPALHLQFSTPRYFTNLGRQTIWNVSAILAVVSLLLCGVAATFIIFLIARPLQVIARHMQHIGASGSLTERLNMSRRDEIGVVANGLDAMVADLKETRQQLELQTYNSGMADLAAGVLHNVRNVLAPIFTSLWSGEQRLNETTNERLFQATAALDLDNVPPDRRRKLVQYIESSTRKADNGRNLALADYSNVKHLAQQIEMILQDHDKISHAARPMQRVELNAVLDDALRQISWPEHPGIEVVKQPSLKPDIMLTSQRVVLIQVLGNIIKNAVEAVELSGNSEKRIEIAWNSHCSDAGELHVRDTGIGIAPEDQGALFSRGYSTRTDRHGGVGLHWCANALAGIGGKIALQSEGIQKGATAVITLPLAPSTRGSAA
jgi:two-component system NtrC family sensor kinase